MKLFTNLRKLISELATLPDTDRVALPENLALPDGDGGYAVLLGPAARFLVQADGAPPRMGYRPWLTVSALRRVFAGAGSDDDALLSALSFQLDRAVPSASADDHPPPLEWPTHATDDERLAWWQACARAYADLWEGHASQAGLAPSSRAELDALEQRLGCPLPPLLRAYHTRIGALNLCENLCSVTQADLASIEPLRAAYPGIADILEDAHDAEAQWQLVDQLVAFGDYLGNGNVWCFHRETGEVWYFDHDSAPMLTRMFSDVGGYLDALMYKCLLEVHEQEDDEDTLRRHLGDAIVDKWMY
ncbi:SMI1/KNR4 family protein [Bordetella sp. N]|uniref:SMI1/KNR4 family protein n=1 Tax=Bordetella sp. N TaxID=1746199 RepID=UPI000A5C4016|nr:SMI1/KNR4 family protein [Bordetella sp. N]